MSNTLGLTLQINAGKDADAEEIDRLTRQLRDEIQEMKVESVDLVKNKKVPEGSKSAEAMAIGVLAVGLLPTIVPQFVEFLRAWSMRGENRRVKIKTQIEGQSIELEFNPEKTSLVEVKRLVNTLTRSRIGYEPLRDEADAADMTADMPRNQVFISYSRHDKEWLQKLQKMLKPFERNHKISIWDDTKVKPGVRWKKELRKALASSKVAVLLISANYFASDFILEHELNHFFQAAKCGGLKILWVPLSSCAYEQTPIAEYQAVIDPARPLDMLTPAEQNQKLVDICKKIEEAMNS